MMTETDGFVETLAAFEFEGNALLSAVLLDDLGGDAGTLDGGSTNGGVLAVVHEENLGKLDFVVSLHREFVDTDGVTFLDAVLLTAGFENCVGHGWSVAKKLRTKISKPDHSWPARGGNSSQTHETGKVFLKIIRFISH